MISMPSSARQNDQGRSPARRERRRHRTTWTLAEEVNAQLLSFLGEKAPAKKNVA
jgi:hypothetical protein